MNWRLLRTRFTAGMPAMLLVLSLLMTAARAAGAETIRCAVIAEPRGGRAAADLAAALQGELSGESDLRWVERDALERVLGEQNLQAVLSPQDVRGRVALGKLVAADVLIIFSKAADASPAAPFQWTICETRQGLRLCAEELAGSGGAPPKAADLAKRAKWAIAKYREQVTEVYAVPPFVSQDLGNRFDHLRFAYAKLVEQAVLLRPGAIAVELTEAQALAKEWALAGAAVRRPLPFYVLGEFRNDGDGAARRQRVSLRLKRGETELGSRQEADLNPSAAAEFIEKSLRELLTGTDLRPAPPDARVEAKQVAARAADFRRLGNWREAADLFEVSLLLSPKQQDVRRQLITVLGEITSRAPPNMGPRTAEEAQRRAAPFLRGLEHLEEFLRTEGDLGKYRQVGQGDFIGDFLHSSGHWSLTGHPHEIPADWKAVLKAAEQRERQTLIRIARQRAWDGRKDDDRFVMRAVSRLPEQEKWDTLVNLLEELQDAPGGGRRVYEYGTHGYISSVLDSPHGIAYLDAASRMRNPQVRATAEDLKKQLPAFREQAKRVNEQFEQMRNPPPPAEEPGPPEVTFLKSDAPRMDCLNVGNGIDVFWNDHEMAVMKRRGELKTVHRLKVNTRFRSVCFDGRFVWAPTIGLVDSEPMVLVYEPASDRTWELTPADGLPPVAFGVPSATSQGVETIAAAPLAPGQVMMCGAADDTWIATVDFDPAKGARFHIFHEAREAADRADREQWRSTRVTFHPVFMHTLTEPGAGIDDDRAKPRQRVILGRASDNISVMQHPLLIDPQTLSVEPILDEMPWYDFKYTSHRGSLYWVGPPWDRPVINVVRGRLWRLGFPEFRKTLSAEAVSNGPREQHRVAFLEDRVLVVGDQVFSAATAAGPFRALRGLLPPHGHWPPPAIVQSAHFGTIIKLKEMYELRFAPSAAQPDVRSSSTGVRQ